MLKCSWNSCCTIASSYEVAIVTALLWWSNCIRQNRTLCLYIEVFSFLITRVAFDKANLLYLMVVFSKSRGNKKVIKIISCRSVDAHCPHKKSCYSFLCLLRVCVEIFYYAALIIVSVPVCQIVPHTWCHTIIYKVVCGAASIMRQLASPTL